MPLQRPAKHGPSPQQFYGLAEFSKRLCRETFWVTDHSNQTTNAVFIVSQSFPTAPQLCASGGSLELRGRQSIRLEISGI